MTRSQEAHEAPEAPAPDGLRVAVLGATGLVGREMLRQLEARRFPVAELRALGSESPRARHVPFGGAAVPVETVTAERLADVDVVLASAGGAVSRRWLPGAAASGAVCIDNTSAFRMDPDVPLVVPEVNADALTGITLGGGAPSSAERRGAIIANPNCSTIQLVVALAPLARAFGLERVLVSTYQSVSGAGGAALAQLDAASRARLDDPETPPPDGEGAVPAFDVLPLIGTLEDDGVTDEERKMMRETPKILGVDVALDVTCVRVPVHVGHAETVVVETSRPASAEDIRAAFGAAPGLALHDDVPTPRRLAGSRDVHVGRLRPAHTFEHGWAFWVVADNLVKGAAWNAVQIAEALVAQRDAGN